MTWLHHDRLGSIRVLTSDAGAVVGTATYDPYGRLTASSGKMASLGFAGEYTDAEMGFVYLRARYYDPATGQLISRDPLTTMTNRTGDVLPLGRAGWCIGRTSGTTSLSSLLPA